MTVVAHDLITVGSDGRMRMHFHPGQWRAWESLARIVVVLAGTQSGKTSFGPAWFYREIQQSGAGDYMVVTPTFTLLEKKALPEFLKHFDRRLRLGQYNANSHSFTFSPEGCRRTFGDAWDGETPCVVYFGYATDPESLESATIKAAWLDEAGQKKFRLAAWEAILRRLSIQQGRILITTTPYDLGWLKQELYDVWETGDPDIEVISFDSTENPVFPIEEYQKREARMPRWRFDMMYRGIFTRPAGLIYDAFDKRRHTCDPFPIPDDWPRYLGLDFGLVHTAALQYAMDPDNRRLYLYREYLHGGFSAREHVERLLAGQPSIEGRHKLPEAVGGAFSEDNWRDEWRKAGLPVKRPDQPDVEVGITRVYATHKRNEITVFRTCKHYLEQKATYSRELDERGEPTEKIEDKETFHFMDAERYLIGTLKRNAEVVARPNRFAWRKVRVN